MSERGGDRKRRGGGGGGGGNKKRWFGSGPKARGGDVCPGLRGFVLTCGGPEKLALTDAYRLLNEEREEMLAAAGENKDPPKEDATSVEADPTDERAAPAEPGTSEEAEAAADTNEDAEEDEEEEDIGAALKKECAEIKDGDRRDKRVFQQYKTHVDKVLFIGCRDGSVDVGRLVESLMAKAAAASTPVSRFLLRLLPIHATVHAKTTEIVPALAKMLTPMVSAGGLAALGLKLGPSYGVQFKARLNKDFHKTDAYDAVGEVMSAVSPLSRCHLSEPDLAIIVEVVKGTALLGVATKLKHFKNYNIQELGK